MLVFLCRMDSSASAFDRLGAILWLTRVLVLVVSMIVPGPCGADSVVGFDWNHVGIVSVIHVFDDFVLEFCICLFLEKLSHSGAGVGGPNPLVNVHPCSVEL